MKYSFLLIADKTESMWPLIVEQALSPLGIFRLISAQETAGQADDSHYDIIMIDSGMIRDPIKLISQLRAEQPQAKIIVATASPTWQRAREVLQAGAVDYIRKSLDQAQLKSKIEALLADNIESG